MQRGTLLMQGKTDHSLSEHSEHSEDRSLTLRAKTDHSLSEHSLRRPTTHSQSTHSEEIPGGSGVFRGVLRVSPFSKFELQ